MLFRSEKLAIFFIDHWKNEIKNIMHSEKYRNEFCLSVGFNLDKVLHDELITRKLQMKYQSNYKPIPEFENSLIFTPMNYRKNLHLIRALSGTNRLAVLLSIYEFRKTIEEFWGKKFVDEFGSEKTFHLKDHTNEDFISNSILFSGVDKQKIKNYGKSKLC